MGLKDHQIVTHGLPIRPDFAKSHGGLAALRRRLGMDPALPAVLLVGGGEGMGKLLQTVRAIAARGVRCQLAVICGRNAALRRQLADGDWGETQVYPFGFVKNMPEFMAASDAIITKAGALPPCEMHVSHACHMHEPGTDVRIWTCDVWCAAPAGAAHICNIAWCICLSHTPSVPPPPPPIAARPPSGSHPLTWVLSQHHPMAAASAHSQPCHSALVETQALLAVTPGESPLPPSAAVHAEQSLGQQATLHASAAEGARPGAPAALAVR